MASELIDIIQRVSALDPATGDELRRQIDGLTNRRANGLNFERHLPEKVALVGRPISVGDKVRFIPVRGQTAVESKVTWVVTKLTGPKSAKVAELLDRATGDTTTREADNLVFVADFRDPIYPGLKPTGSVERGGPDKPFHSVINSENYHALEALLFTHAGKVDAIYIDPPYNSGARDWKYNNDYVDGQDAYRHSKWLSFMERRLKLAKKLLNPANSVMIVTIDEKEYLRLGLLLEQTFPNARIQMISAVINPKGTSRPDMFSRVDEYIFFVLFGSSVVPGFTDSSQAGKPVRWRYLRREDDESVRGSRPRQFYPVFVNDESGIVFGVGRPLSPVEPLTAVTPPPGCTAVYPIREDGVQMEWGLTGSTLMAAAENGYVRATPGHVHQPYIISYLTAPNIKKVMAGELVVTGTREDGSKIVVAPDGKVSRPVTVWWESRHSAGDHGTKVIGSLLPGRKFPFPKSLYAVEDSLRFFVADKPESLILDFFAGSGTTAHAVMRLNKQDDGRRRCISVTNNEVSVDEQSALIQDNRRPGDPQWEALGICDYITKPRIEAAVTGLTPSGDPVKGDYKFTDVFPMADGFEENVEFFTLTYLNPQLVELDMAFTSIAPLLWMRAGSHGRRIDERTATFDIADTYAVLFGLDASAAFLDAVEHADGLRVAYIVTDDEPQFQAVASQLPEGIEAVRLYESYLRTFQINTERA